MVVCLDELQVTDIADAVILAGLFRAMRDAGICLVTTSNTLPDDLYKNGLQRLNFLPAIDLIKQQCTILNFSTLLDYRSINSSHMASFYYPNDATAEHAMQIRFAILNRHVSYDTQPIIICERNISVIRKSVDIIWFDFQQICRSPRSPADYLALVKQFKIIFISNIPRITASQKDRLNLFIRMIDIFYDARIQFVCSAETSLQDIYCGDYMQFEYQRTQSRLLEMLS